MESFLQLLADPVRMTALLARVRADDAALRCLTTVARLASPVHVVPPEQSDDATESHDDASLDFDDDDASIEDDTFGDADEDELR